MSTNKNKINILEDLPQLIVALDSLEDSANYIHINDVQDNAVYYCPCCKGIVRPRAYKENIEYKVQPHYYHEAGGCSEESFVHYICKNWLLEKGCKFIVEEIEYETDSIEIEKTLHTKFGDYRPDIIVTTTIGKIFYFEIKYSNKKKTDYVSKWDELGNDVVEVDTRYFINQKFKNDIPVFNLIYSDGVCFIKSYSRNDYENTIAKRKLEWKRQDKLNYKIQWERLDWFWNELIKFKNHECSVDDVLLSFKSLSYDDQVWCYLNIKNKSCVQFKEDFSKIINDRFKIFLSELSHKYDLKISYNRTSKLIYTIKIQNEYTYEGYSLYDYSSMKLKMRSGILQYTNEIEKKCRHLAANREKNLVLLENMKDFSKLPFIRSILPNSHYECKYYLIDHVSFDVVFEDYVHNKHIKEKIGTYTHTLSNITRQNILDKYQTFKSEAKNNLNNYMITQMLKNDSSYSYYISILMEEYKKVPNLQLIVSGDLQEIILRKKNEYKTICIFNYNSSKDFIGIFEEEVYELFKKHIDNEFKTYEEFTKIQKSIEEIVQRVNSSKHWRVKLSDKNKGYIITLYIDGELIGNRDIILNYDTDQEKIQRQFISKLKKSMKQILNEKHSDFRIMEVRG